MILDKLTQSCAIFGVHKLKVEELLKAVKTSCNRFSTVEKRTKVMASPPVISWDTYFNQNRERLVEQVQKKYGSKDKKQIDSEINSKVSMWKGDITKLEIDAIVNAANSSLLGGGGGNDSLTLRVILKQHVVDNLLSSVDGAIHRTAGPSLKEECSKLGGCKVGEAKITNGYNLPSKHVIHTVGPQGEKPDLLKSCYDSSLQQLIQKNLRTVAFPCISTGIYGYPQEPAAHVALKTVRTFLEKNKNSVDQVIFCLFLPEDVTIYENLLQIYFPVE